MPLVEITTVNFPSTWPTPNGTLSIDVSSDEVCKAAAEVGATSAVFGNPSRTWREFLWRVNMILSSLDKTSGGWEQNFSYKRLDPSEKSGVSYYLGMVLPAIIAKKLWNTPHLVHVDAVLKIRAQKIGNVRRPDLVGYRQGATANSLGRLLLEAKGRTNGFAQPPVKAAKNSCVKRHAKYYNSSVALPQGLLPFLISKTTIGVDIWSTLPGLLWSLYIPTMNFKRS